MSASNLRRAMSMGGARPGPLATATALAVATAAGTVALMACSGALIDRAALRPPLYTLLVLMAAVQLVALARGPLRFAERVVAHDAALGVRTRLQLWLYDVVELRSPAALGLWRHGDLLSRATADVDQVQDCYLRGLSPVVVSVSTAVFASALLAVLLPLAGAVMAAGSGGALLVSCAMAWGRHRRSGTGGAALRGRLAAEVAELFEGAPDLTAFGVEGDYLEKALATDRELSALEGRRAWTAGVSGAVVTLFAGFTVAGLVSVAVPAMAAGRLPGYMTAVLPPVALGVFEVVPPAAEAVARLAEELAAAARLLDVADLPVPVVDPPNPAPCPEQADVRLDGVRLRYSPDAPWALDGLTMELPAGARVAVVGPSGAGKSSVVNLLLRFWERAEGTARLGGVPLEQLAQDQVRARVGWVPQDAYLFNTTVRANILIGREGATDEEVTAAAQAAQLGPWVDSLPLGLETRVGEDGELVSGGERQRIALARALLAGTPLVILDEPTSGLDRPTAARLAQDLRSVTAASGAGVLIITHRLEELSGCDIVVQVDQGRVRAVHGGPVARDDTSPAGPS